jgi:hypothetical protein
MKNFRPRTRSREEEGEPLPQSHELNQDDLKELNQGLYLYEQELRTGSSTTDELEAVRAYSLLHSIPF